MGIINYDIMMTDIKIVNISNPGSRAYISFSAKLEDGTSKVFYANLRDLPCYREKYGIEPRSVKLLKKLYCGFLKRKLYMLFRIQYADGGEQLVQAEEGSPSCLKLLEYSVKLAENKASELRRNPGDVEVQPYKLHNNELPRGTYTVGEEIPEGIYDFFVIYGKGGYFVKSERDANGRTVEDTAMRYWIGLKESYEHRELIHIRCMPGESITISGNVILKIARSKNVKIEL